MDNRVTTTEPDADDELPEAIEEVTITGAAARKIGRLSALFPESDIRIRAFEGECGEGDDLPAYWLTVDFRDEYDLRTIRGVVVHANGWSNPSVARLRKEVHRA